jgi:site-specific DNA-methyltransferase (adenine-specific)
VIIQMLDDYTNKITLGDCSVVLKEFPDNCIDLIITDPPYGVNFENGNYDDSSDWVFTQYEEWLKEFARVLKLNHHIYIFVPTLEVDKWIKGVKEVLNFNNLIATQVFQTNRTSSIKNNFTFDLQLIIFASKEKALKFNKVDWIPTSNSWLRDKRNPSPKKYSYQYPSFISPKIERSNVKPNKEYKLLHPNEKNPNLIKKFIEMSSNQEDIVLDPFCGSGSTAIAAWEVGRRFIMIEKNFEYNKTAIQRIRRLGGQKKIAQFLK